jgi:hypothetical protein
MIQVMTNLVAFVLAALGFFGIGYEAAHGVNALWEHWYCPAPIAVLFVAAGLWLLGVRTARRT